MDDQTDRSQLTHHQSHKQPHLILSSKPTCNEINYQRPSLYYGLASFNYCQLDLNQGKLIYESPQIHEGRIRGLRQKDYLLTTVSEDNSISLFDIRTHQHIHTFKKIPGHFGCVDKAQHIIAAGSNNNIVFWDLRKMKQRSEFKDSFQQQVTSIKFDANIPTNLYGCSLDGMINMFDLTQPNEQDAFNWCYKILQSPQSLSNVGNLLLTTTTDHILYKIDGGEFISKITPNCPEKPKHVVESRTIGDERYQYCAWNIEQKLIEIWQGYLRDKQDNQNCRGYIKNVEDIELMNIINDMGVLADERGQLFIEPMSLEKDYKEKGMSMMEEGVECDRNGYILKRSSMLKMNGRFRPY